LDNPGTAWELGQAGFQRVHRHFTWRRAAEQTVSVYREAVGGYRRLRPS
jgi:glycosyltransferase involved in cell wall biosynthesis